ncbi:hypothetical protein BGZ63DRAFT_116582 [Mariannaea sp. PMI_226]|nr:hypothetical protein BGZ63DRAFT_116582 [Mariannaea sp. PMI_226]
MRSAVAEGRRKLTNEVVRPRETAVEDRVNAAGSGSGGLGSAASSGGMSLDSGIAAGERSVGGVSAVLYSILVIAGQRSTLAYLTTLEGQAGGRGFVGDDDDGAGDGEIHRVNGKMQACTTQGLCVCRLMPVVGGGERMGTGEGDGGRMPVMQMLCRALISI